MNQVIIKFIIFKKEHYGQEKALTQHKVERQSCLMAEREKGTEQCLMMFNRMKKHNPCTVQQDTLISLLNSKESQGNGLNVPHS